MHPDENPPEDLKRRINELLWTCLPGNTTLSEAESLASVIHADVINVWTKKVLADREDIR